jgi:UPF0716 family protein affecting phage T7 exclusion
LTHMKAWERWIFALAALLFIAPGWQSGLAGLVLALPVVLSQFVKRSAPAAVT